jgi:hypothetical protein
MTTTSQEAPKHSLEAFPSDYPQPPWHICRFILQILDGAQSGGEMDWCCRVSADVVAITEKQIRANLSRQQPVDHDLHLFERFAQLLTIVEEASLAEWLTASGGERTFVFHTRPGLFFRAWTIWFLRARLAEVQVDIEHLTEIVSGPDEGDDRGDRSLERTELEGDLEWLPEALGALETDEAWLGLLR